MVKKLWLTFVALFWALLLLPVSGVHAQTLHYSVSAELPSNQVDADLSYFNLKVTPGQQQNLTIRIQNTDSSAHQYRVSVNRAATNINGVIDYTKHNVKQPNSLKANIESMVPQPETVTVPAKTTKNVSLTLKAPQEAFQGIALAGIQVAELDTSASNQKSKGLSLTNKFAYVIGLQVQTQADVTHVKPKLVLHSVKAKQINYRNNVSANLENTQPTIIHKLKVNAKVLKRGSTKAVFHMKKANMSVAPNSAFALPINANNTPLKAGKYTLDLTATASNGKYHWHFTKNFTITTKTANKLNKTAVDQKHSHNWMLWLIIGLAVLIIILLGVVIVLIKRRRPSDQ
ncbi:DUF916 and DUF3324 domain-containing protein [Loigolactobacillus bifermentans]|uniref:Cell surface protein n=1 Tax=Loigolactobacillus bifermentans DSM 20003 TaxID=1423726 RepID=A0A0R1GSV6_9LACO|nr:DUF916 and DUF3324 domain-containing protein [Loigolactobacillus bifermentans]KRK35443.1 cell surface protein [Loigolactobacillus bifermentans DSM 20003]QGG60429.1 DUF3324 domain-containing protein [Loigolactobacillus bifermentans]